ncbi:hypothetical protein R2G56_08520 [Nitratireductor aquimarinus]|uniref:ParB/Sulfiredoxin domain-containing protein n=1 Tax=Nitratireductor aquimarinus TaxID=889300 RepID=A0ABU4AJL8_9HYPH|nr:hypothetical protein [Nitratireductor aquimarinus]MDV6226326.1 hypothetical protein [Nitratireductor aquimarinus]
MFIAISSISLDVKNFRHPEVAEERDAIRALLQDDKVHKVAELAEDIVALGQLDPSARLIVTEASKDSGTYIALEGNRRLCALKTLASPELAKGLPVYAKFAELSSDFLRLNIQEVDCVVLERDEAAKWIKRRHYKGVGGASLIPWNAVATARSDAAEGRVSRWMKTLAFLENNGVEAEQIRDRIASKTTTVERVLSGSPLTNVLGISFKKDEIIAENGDTAKAVRLLTDIMEAMAQRDFKESIVSSKEQQEGWLSQFEALNVKSASKPGSEQEPRQGNGEKQPGNRQTTSAQNNSIYSPSPANTTKGESTGTGTPRRSSPPRERKVLAKAGLQISNAPLARFYQELRKIQVKNYPYTCAPLIRVFLEKATTTFLEENNVPPLNKKPDATWNDGDIKLRQKVDAALKHIDPSETNPHLEYARQVAKGTPDALHSIDQLNRAVHDNKALPSPSELITIWDRYHEYFSALSNPIDKKTK